MNFVETGFKDLYVIEVNQIKDNRGLFGRTFCKNEFQQIGFTKEFVQMNFSFNFRKGTFRGFHFQQPPYEETKLIRCSSGKVLDIAIDLRKNSTTYLQHFNCEISKQNRKMILIPEGFAHGFITLEANTELVYCHTAFYNPEHESGISIKDVILQIELPIPIACISKKDLSYSPYKK